MDFFTPADEEHVRAEKNKARDMRKSQWWKNQLGKGLCHYCGNRFHPSELTLDHVVPIIRGGKTTKSNVVTCCKACNTDKSYKLPVEWRNLLDDDGDDTVD